MFDFPELDPITRRYMLSEFRAEQEDKEIGPYRPSGFVGDTSTFRGIMERALEEGDEQSLTIELSVPQLWEEHSQRVVKERLREYRVPYDVQAKRFAITDFNTWYVRGLSRRLMEEGVDSCEIFRADRAYQPRAECRKLEGARLAVDEVYAGHRIRYHHPRMDPRALSVPSGPNCHHAIRRLGDSNFAVWKRSQSMHAQSKVSLRLVRFQTLPLPG